MEPDYNRVRIPFWVTQKPLEEYGEYRCVIRRFIPDGGLGAMQPGRSFPHLSPPKRERLEPMSADSVMIRVRAVAVNSRDVRHHANYGPHTIPCSDAAGDIVRVGANAMAMSPLRLGMSVCTIPNRAWQFTHGNHESQYLGVNIDGVLASHLVVHWKEIERTPPGMTWTQAAYLPTAGLTAWKALKLAHYEPIASPYPPQQQSAGSVVLHGISNVTVMALQIALKANCSVLMACSDERMIQTLREEFTDRKLEFINTTAYAQWGVAAWHHFQAKGADIVIQSTETPDLTQSIQAVKRGGTVCLFGPQDLNHDFWNTFGPLVWQKQAGVQYVDAGSREDFQEMIRVIQEKHIAFKDPISEEYEFENSNAAFERMRLNTGRIGNVVIKLPILGTTLDNQEGYPIEGRTSYGG